MEISDLAEALPLHRFLWQLFKPFADEKEPLCDWLAREELGQPFVLWHHDELLRRLYWANLLVERNGGFSWRCDAIQKVGQRVLKCEAG